MSNRAFNAEISRGPAYRNAPKVEVKSIHPALPGWYRRETSFIADKEVNIEKFLANLSERTEADCRKGNDSSLEGVLYKSGSQVNFEINIFTDDKNADSMAQTVVEFARVSGCSIEFSEFYREMKQLFAKSDIGCTTKTEAHSFKPPALSFPAGTEAPVATIEDARDSLNVALNVASSVASSTAAEGLLLVASVFESESSAEHIAALLDDNKISERLEATLTASLASTARADIRVNAAVAVAKLTDSKAGLAWVAEHGFVKQMQCFQNADQVDGLTQLQKDEVYRQVARCVSRAIQQSANGANITPEHVSFFIDYVKGLPSSKRNDSVKEDLKDLETCASFSQLKISENAQ